MSTTATRSKDATTDACRPELGAAVYALPVQHRGQAPARTN
jgi:hypothetical protein